MLSGSDSRVLNGMGIDGVKGKESTLVWDLGQGSWSLRLSA